MTMKPVLAGLALLMAAGGSQAATILAEDFDNVGNLPVFGWVQVNNSTAPIGTEWFQGNSGIFPSFSGAANSYVAANFLGTGSATGAVSNWLILPVLTLDSSSVLSFMVRAAGDGFLDKLEVRFSPNVSSTNVGTTSTSVGDFSMLLGTFSASTDTGWQSQSFGLGSLSAPTTGRLAFRYVVDSVATAGNYIGIDSLTVTGAVPEPATYLLMALGVAGLVLRRRAAA